MQKSEFDEIVALCFESLPEIFKTNIDNVQFSVEDYPTRDQLSKIKHASKYSLLGLYEGVPLKFRGPGYGMSAMVPDRITLFQNNIESVSMNETDLKNKIREVLMHEIGHYFGMTEDEIRKAGY